MGKASSAKKVARIAERGRGKKVRFQGGTVFPVIVAIVIVLGIVLVGGSRHLATADAAGPKIGTHWHEAYGIYVCDHYLKPFQSNKESDPQYQLLQIHTHGDGVMHWHPSNEQAIGRTTGKSAQFRVFLGLYGVSLTDTKLSITGSELTPATANQVYEAGKTTCTVNGKKVKASLRTIVWNRYDEPNNRTVHTSNLGHERILKDQQVFVVAFVPTSLANSDIPLPSWASVLPTLTKTDTATTASTTTTVAGQTTTTVAGQTTVATTVAPTTTVPVTTN
jgi:hypothetical protein